MRLSKIQRRSLGIYLRFRDERPTILKLAKTSLWRLLLISVYCLTAALLFYFFRSAWGVGLMLGILIGFLSATVAQLRLFLKVWPAAREVLDWARVEALLEQ
jgi:F0F1-type ATP synthase assembly protein I